MQDKFEFKQTLKSPLGPKLQLDGKEYLYFGGTAYLGIPQNKSFLNHYLEGIKQFGLNNGTSRNNNVQLGIYDLVEKYAAERYQAPSALITSSGFLAAQFVLKSIFNLGEVRYAPATHPALWEVEIPKVNGSFTDWTKAIVAEINTSNKKNWVLISNAMNNLYPEVYDFSFLHQIESSKQIILLIDDSHGIGINNGGLSAFSSFTKPKNTRVLVIASMAKALGIDAGLILGNEDLVQEIKNDNAFLGASPPAAAGLYAFMKGEEIYHQELKKLQSLSNLLASHLVGRADWHFVSGFPVFLSKNADLSANLFKKQILVSSFPYPDRDGPILNRIVLSSWHAESDVKTLITSLD
jgi:8-amino-7-oxononanoate synthase